MENGSSGVVVSTMEAGASSGSSWVGEEQGEEKKVCDEAAVVVEDEEEEEEEEEVHDGDHGAAVGFVPGPLVSLKEHLDKDKDDESLRRWKEQLLGCIDSDLNGQTEPEVKFQSIGIVSTDCGETTTPLLADKNQSCGVLFTLQEGSVYRFKLTFTVQHNIVSGLAYTNTVWKGGLKVDEGKGMLGTFAPQREPYIHNLDEEITPSGLFARGSYSAKLKFVDDDKRCHLELKYTFEIRQRS